MPVCWIMWNYYRKKFYVYYFWELKGSGTFPPNTKGYLRFLCEGTCLTWLVHTHWNVQLDGWVLLSQNCYNKSVPSNSFSNVVLSAIELYSCFCVCNYEWAINMSLNGFIMFGLQWYEWLTKSDNCKVGVGFVYHEYDYTQNWMTRKSCYQ